MPACMHQGNSYSFLRCHWIACCQTLYRFCEADIACEELRFQLPLYRYDQQCAAFRNWNLDKIVRGGRKHSRLVSFEPTFCKLSVLEVSRKRDFGSQVKLTDPTPRTVSFWTECLVTCIILLVSEWREEESAIASLSHFQQPSTWCSRLRMPWATCTRRRLQILISSQEAFSLTQSTPEVSPRNFPCITQVIRTKVRVW